MQSSRIGSIVSMVMVLVFVVNYAAAFQNPSYCYKKCSEVCGPDDKECLGFCAEYCGTSPAVPPTDATHVNWAVEALHIG